MGVADHEFAGAAHAVNGELAWWRGRDAVFLWVLLAAWLLKGVFWASLVPLGRGPDESSHFVYVNNLARGMAPPVNGGRIPQSVDFIHWLSGTDWDWRPAAADGRPLRLGYQMVLDEWEARRYAGISEHLRNNEGGQPPLYYAIAAAITAPFRWVGTVLWHWQSMRWVSVLLSAVPIVVLWQCGRLLFPGEEAAWRFLPAFVYTFHPMTTFVGAMVNNDNALLAMAALGAGAVLLRWPLGRSALLAGMAVAAKMSGLALVAWWILGRGRDLWRTGRLWWVVVPALLVGPVLASAAFTSLTTGRLSYLTFLEETHAEYPVEVPLELRIERWIDGAVWHVAEGFNARFGWDWEPMPWGWHVWRVVFVSGVGALLAVRVLGRGLRPLAAEEWRLLGLAASFVVLWVGLLWAGGWRAINHAGYASIQGRMGLPMLVPVLVLLPVAMGRASGLPAWASRVLLVVVYTATLWGMMHATFRVIASLLLQVELNYVDPWAWERFGEAIACGRPRVLAHGWLWTAWAGVLWVGLPAVGAWMASSVYTGRMWALAALVVLLGGWAALLW